MNLRENVKASRAIGDTLLALDDSNNLHSWDALSGKLIGSRFYSEFDFTKYMVHTRSNFKIEGYEDNRSFIGSDSSSEEEEKVKGT